jgi:molybdopterin molybdotransferase/putative molybdopterin biosynthesis protein
LLVEPKWRFFCMTEQQQFLDVIDRDEAERRFHAALTLKALDGEPVALAECLGRVIAQDVVAPVDVPSFDRANVDGYAVHAADTFGASEQQPRRVRLSGRSIAAGRAVEEEVAAGQAISIATGGMLPRGADAVVMVEHTDVVGGELLVRRAVAAGANVTFAGTDIAAGQLVLHAGELITSRESGVLAAIGIASVPCVRRPRVAVISTGDEIIAPGQPMQPGFVYDSNARTIADAVRELGGEAVELGIVRDDELQLRQMLDAALRDFNVVLLSGGTSKGAGDLSYRVVSELCDPGIVAHGVALKPGKPICLAVTRGKPVVVLPGFPTSAIFTFHEFVAPVIRALAGHRQEESAAVSAELAVKVNSEIGRTEYLLVNLIKADDDRLFAWPMGKGSGSVTTFSKADGFVTIGRHEEIVERGANVQVTPLGRGRAPADLVVIGSHCVGLDLLLAEMQRRGWRTKSLTVGSTAGLEAAKRGQCDVAGVHLLDPVSGSYNQPFLTPELTLVRGYGRMQGIVFRPDDDRFAGKSTEQVIAAAITDNRRRMVNRNFGSGTRILIDRLLGGATPPGYEVQPTNHNAVAAAVAQRRADWGLCIETVARHAGLGFLPMGLEHYDFIVPGSRATRPAVREFCRLVASCEMRQRLAQLGFSAPATGSDATSPPRASS